MRLLFVKPSLAWPRTTGHDVYCYHMMKGLSRLGAEVALATVEPCHPEATEGFSSSFICRLADEPTTGAPTPTLTWAQERFRSYWGIDHDEIRAVNRIAARWKPDVVIAFGLSALPYLSGVADAVRVWAMADEWVYHHLAQVRVTDRASWVHVKDGLLKGAYERAYRGLVDRIWVVSETDRKAAKYFAGMPVADLLPNGVDTDFFAPMDRPVQPRTAIFWGSLLFQPNIDALQWFCSAVWPGVRAQVPDAHFTIMGYAPTPEVQRLADLPGVSLLPNVPDIRPLVCEHAVVVLPFLSGGGIKNKLLEGAAMGRPMISTPQAVRDLTFDGPRPIMTATTADEWIARIVELWRDDVRRRDLGQSAREWVTTRYSWDAPARGAFEAFQRAIANRSR
jgi:glycosyltransferase involved in cell wall biosynthesis